MTRNILLTSPDIPESGRPLRYYSVPGESGRSYCEALQGMEASTRYILSRFPIDEILILDQKESSDGADGGKPFRLRDAGLRGKAEPADLTPAFAGLGMRNCRPAFSSVSISEQARAVTWPRSG